MRPANLLIIMADQHSRKVLGSYGHPLVRTPNLDNPDEVTKILSMCEVDRINMEGSEDLAWYYPYEYVDA